MTDITHTSCGCVFCDIGLDPERHKDGRLVHYRWGDEHRAEGEFAVCTNEAGRAALAKQ